MRKIAAFLMAFSLVIAMSGIALAGGGYDGFCASHDKKLPQTRRRRTNQWRRRAIRKP
jgi:hypothetical protein